MGKALISLLEEEKWAITNVRVAQSGLDFWIEEKEKYGMEDSCTNENIKKYTERVHNYSAELLEIRRQISVYIKRLEELV